MNMDVFVRDILGNAADMTGRYTNINPSVSLQASEILEQYKLNSCDVTGAVFGIDIKSGTMNVSRWGSE